MRDRLVVRGVRPSGREISQNMDSLRQKDPPSQCLLLGPPSTCELRGRTVLWSALRRAECEVILELSSRWAGRCVCDGGGRRAFRGGWGRGKDADAAVW